MDRANGSREGESYRGQMVPSEKKLERELCMSSGVVGPKLWTAQDLASYLAVPVGWIYDRTRREGPERIPHTKLGKYCRFDPASPAFQDWLKQHQVGG